MKQIGLICMISLFFGTFLSAQTVVEQREKARKLKTDGSFAEALTAYEAYLFTPGLPAGEIVRDMGDSLECLQQLNRVKESDALIDRVLEIHGDHLNVVTGCAQAWLSLAPWGFKIAGEFERGFHRGGGEAADARERDRSRALQVLVQAMPRVAGNPPDVVANYYEAFADTLASQRMAGGAWRLQELNDFDKLADYGTGSPWWGWRGWRSSHEAEEEGAAPVTDAGEPVYYNLPESWEKAANDGERWRWCLSQLEKSGRKDAANERLAEFAINQFGTETLARYGSVFTSDRLASSAIWNRQTLKENETVAQLAPGAKRFTLPEDYNYMRLARELAQSSSYWADRLAILYQNRRQFGAAATAWQMAIDKHGADAERLSALNQIVKPWVRVESAPAQTPVNAATFDLIHRNASAVGFSVRAIDTDALLRDFQNLLKSNPNQIEWWQTQVENIGNRIAQGDGHRYIGEKVVAWREELQPREGHFDARKTITAPKPLPAGAYQIIAKADDGNEARAILWIADTVLMRKTLTSRSDKPNDQQELVLVLDAETGDPLADVDLEIFAWRQEYNNPGSARRITFHTRSTRLKSDASGSVTTPPGILHTANQHWQATIIARTAEGRLAFTGLERVWGSYYNPQAAAFKVYGITDRPVYRPADTVNFKVWSGTASYDAPQRSELAGRRLGIVIRNPRGEEIFDKTYTADGFGGVDGKFELPQDLPLGTYYLMTRQSGNLRQAVSFRVEEYKKPEFEVVVKSPEKPVALGEKIEVEVKAVYNFGAPVTAGKVKVKVVRQSQRAEWWPTRTWDWLYGVGYAWYGYDYGWWPGWARWGLCRPMIGWWAPPPPPPEVVLEIERTLGDDGSLMVAFDTALTKELYGDTDHSYQITAEVTDLSRRTITGQGKVLVAHEPFRVYTWVDRTISRVGDDLVASVRAQTADGKEVQGKVALALYRVDGFDADGQPQEVKIDDWQLEIGAAGFVRHTLAASRQGQYRLVGQVTDAAGRTLEGAQVFVVRGEGDDGRNYRFADLELVPDKAEYAPGDKLQLQINTDAADSTVLLFVRPVAGTVADKPQVLKIDGKSTTVPIDIAVADRPNIFVEAVTVRGGKVHTEVREIVIPPEDKVVNVAVTPDAEKVLPGAETGVTVKLTDLAGEPCDGSVVLAVYDKAVEYVSGGSNVSNMRDFFWKWRRQHQPRINHTLNRPAGAFLLRNEIPMTAIGLFGAGIADEPFSGVETLRRESAPMPAAAGAPMGMARSRQALGGAMLAAAPMAADMMVAEKADFGGAPPSEMAEPTIRSEFADTAFWSPDLKPTGEPGIYRATFKMPDDLTGWKTRAWAMAPAMRVGEGASEIVTAKNLMVRLQAPRFFTQSDEVVLSGIVHNYLEEAQNVQAVLELEGSDGAAVELLLGDATQTLEVAPKGEKRVDWRIRVLQPGSLLVRMKALTATESDAMQRSFPVQIHGMLKTEAWSGVLRPPAAGQGRDSATVDFRVPAERRVEQTRFEVRWSPTLAGALLDAMPWLAGRPEDGSTEQTLNRFLPAVMVRHTLTKLGVNLADTRQRLTNLNPQELGDDRQRIAEWQRLKNNPVFDEGELDRIVRDGIARLAHMQLSDGGWGWYSGFGEYPSAHMSATVVRGLLLARESGADVPDEMLARGSRWLRNYQEKRIKDLVEDKFRHPDNLDALVAQVLAQEGFADPRMLDRLYEDRNHLAFYGKALLGLTFDRLKDNRRDMLVRNCVQFLKEDAENQSAWFELGSQGYWWFWYGNEIEAQATGLRLLLKTQPQSSATAGLVKYLLNNRRHATYWNSTRDTALCLEALAEYLRLTGEGGHTMQVEVRLDGVLHKTVEITPERLFDFDNAFVVEGADLTDGEHRLEITRIGEGPLYFNAYLTNFTLEDPITATGLEVKVERRIYRLKETTKTGSGRGARGESIAQEREHYERELLKADELIRSGELLEIELIVESKNDYEYLVIEDMRPAGCEAVEVRSGYISRGLRSYVEFRDNRTTFNLTNLARGRHSTSYRVRAEIPGRFSALPAVLQAVYAPELRANSDEAKVQIRD